MPIERLSFGDLHIEGVSRAGDETWIRVRPPGLVFDVGRGAAQLAGADDLFLSHGHLDHALGLPYVLSQRTLHAAKPTRVFAPAATVERLENLIGAAESLEEESYSYELRALEPGDRVTVGKDLKVEAFATDHVVASLGYHLLRDKKRLKTDFAGRTGRELTDLKDSGVEIQEQETQLWLSYCGDTGPAVFDLDPRVYDTPKLLIECTFFDSASQERAREFGHMHLDDLVARAADFRNQDLILHHTSRRYSREQLEQIVAQRLPLEDTRVQLFGC